MTGIDLGESLDKPHDRVTQIITFVSLLMMSAFHSITCQLQI